MKLDFIWITKYRRPILTKEVVVGVRKPVREVCLVNEVQIFKGYISRDLVHRFVSVLRSPSASKLMKYINGKTSR